jgi:hypothetical protein
MTPSRLLVASTALALATAAAWNAPASAAVSCGATITADTTLTPSDPVTTTACPSNGITLGADNITLDCGGLTIRGKGRADGIRLGTGVEGVAIQNCTVDHFSVGVLLAGAGGATVDRVLSQNNTSDGVSVISGDNFLSVVLSQHNTGSGFKIAGDANSIDSVVAVGNGKAGFSLTGKDHDLESSQAITNTGDGWTGNVNSTLFISNTAIGNKHDGFDIAGGTINLPNEFDANRAFANGGNGLVVGGVNPDINVDGGDNVGLGNAGAIQCQIAGAACQ